MSADTSGRRNFVTHAGSLDIIGRTDAGRVRGHNEDAIGENADIGLIVLADGMGGYKGGEVASALAVNTILQELEIAIPGIAPGETDSDTGYSRQSLAARHSIIKANETIYKTAQSQPQYQGMGTTVVMGIFHNNNVTVAHVGDSRMYRYRDEKLEQITVDHTLLQELVDRGFYTQEEARESLNKNLVTRALGIETSVAVDIYEDLAFPGDIYLLCSDGLNDMIDDEDIHLTIKTFSASLDKAADHLIQLANENGGKDNVSVVLARPTKVFSGKRHWRQRLIDWFF
ncbi:MAG: Stp1/IreP family PP2C-type Ser/Thr phosphatase [Gammaproteobacteria bacterium]